MKKNINLILKGIEIDEKGINGIKNQIMNNLPITEDDNESDYIVLTLTLKEKTDVLKIWGSRFQFKHNYYDFSLEQLDFIEEAVIEYLKKYLKNDMINKIIEVDIERQTERQLMANIFNNFYNEIIKNSNCTAEEINKFFEEYADDPRTKPLMNIKLINKLMNHGVSINNIAKLNLTAKCFCKLYSLLPVETLKQNPYFMKLYNNNKIFNYLFKDKLNGRYNYIRPSVLHMLLNDDNITDKNKERMIRKTIRSTHNTILNPIREKLFNELLNDGVTINALAQMNLYKDVMIKHKEELPLQLLMGTPMFKYYYDTDKEFREIFKDCKMKYYKSK